MAEMCNIHTDKEVVGTCINCGKGVCADCISTISDKTYCQDCAKTLDLGPAGDKKALEWENRGNAGLFNTLFKTWFNIVFHPKEFFSNMPTSGGLKMPLIFAVIWGGLAVIISGVINLGLQASGNLPIPAGAEAPSGVVLTTTYLVLIVLSPLLVALGLFIGAGIYQLSVLIFGGRKGFEPTFRVICYVNAVSVFNLIPIVGPLFVTIYSVVLFCLGFKRVHQMSTVKAVFAALLPMIALFLLAFFGALAASVSGLPVGVQFPSATPGFQPTIPQ